MKVKIAIFILTLLCFSISGCGGGSGTGSIVPQSSPTLETGSLEMQAIWPKEGEDIAAQVIQPEVVRIEIKITGDNIPSPIIIYLNKGETSKIISDIPAGNIQIEFKGLDANGNVLSSRITNVTVTGGQTIPVSVILGVSILSDGFFPSTITLYKGDTLVFVNNDGLTHSFSVPELFRSGDVPTGGTFSYKFGNTSLLTYTCTREDGKILIIIIKDGNYETQPPAHSVKEIFVDDANGSDPNGDGTISNPYKTLDKGVEVANNDYTIDIVNVRALDEPDGRHGYNARIDGGYYDPNTSLTLRSNLIVRKYPYDPNECIIDFNRIDTSTSRAGFILTGTNTLQGFTIMNVIEGSGIKVNGINCNINNCIIEGNGMTEETGKMSSSEIIPVINGGGINVNSGTCNINNCLLLGNSTINGIFDPNNPNTPKKKINNRDKTLRNISKDYNVKTEPFRPLPDYGYGGGVFVNAGTSCYLNDSTLIGNSALLGGAIANFGICNVTGRTDWYDTNKTNKDEDPPNLIFMNFALYGGGAIANKGTCNLHTIIMENFTGFLFLDRSQIKASDSDSVLDGGGAIVNIGTCNIKGSIIEINLCDSYGGGICNTVYPPYTGTCNISENTLITGNVSCDGAGGGIYNTGNCNITDTTIEGNGAVYGGGIWNDFVDLTDSIIMGICTMNRVTIESNDAEYNGGGICNFASCIFNSNVKIKNNTADADGGGIYNDEAGTINFGSVPGVIEGNHADNDDGSDGTGGGIYDNTGTINNPPSPGIFGTGNYKGSGTGTIDNFAP